MSTQFTVSPFFGQEPISWLRRVEQHWNRSKLMLRVNNLLVIEGVRCPLNAPIPLAAKCCRVLARVPQKNKMGQL